MRHSRCCSDHPLAAALRPPPPLDSMRTSALAHRTSPAEQKRTGGSAAEARPDPSLVGPAVGRPPFEMPARFPDPHPKGGPESSPPKGAQTCAGGATRDKQRWSMGVVVCGWARRHSLWSSCMDMSDAEGVPLVCRISTRGGAPVKRFSSEPRQVRAFASCCA